MITLENDNVVFRFSTYGNDGFSLNFQRTLRVPDSDNAYSLPAGLGRFPLRHVEDFKDALPKATVRRGGIMMPIWQAEAMWINFDCGDRSGLPVAIKVAAGKVNAISGEHWRPGLHSDPQDYVVSPDQPWLDGFAIERGKVRQFVAMPIGKGYSVEEQISNSATWGGLQLSVIPLTPLAWQQQLQQSLRRHMGVSSSPVETMSFGAGGIMKQNIARDRRNIDDWDVEAAERVFVTLVNASDWKRLTGEPAPSTPPTALDYKKANIPWYEYYASDQNVLDGSDKLSKLKSVAAQFKENTGVALPQSADVTTPEPICLGPDERVIKNSTSWDS